MKRLDITPEIQQRLNTAAGTQVDPSKIAAYECLAMTSAPIQQPGSIYNGATNDRAMWLQMADFVNNGGSVPLQIMHESEDINTGRVFYAGVIDNDLHAQFYLMANDPRVPLIDQGIIGQVSVAVQSQAAKCSQCGFDYLGPDATAMNWWNRTCPEGHVIGEDGTHLELSGLDHWFELSLVGTGASPGAKILNRATAQLSEVNLAKLAASGLTLGATMMVAKCEEPKVAEFDFKPYMDRLEASAQLLAEQKVRLAELDATKVKVQELEADLATAQAELAKMNSAEYTAMKDFLSDMAKKALIASGKTEEPATSFEALKAQIMDSGKHLANLAALSQSHQETAEHAGESTAACFKTFRKGAR